MPPEIFDDGCGNAAISKSPKGDFVKRRKESLSRFPPRSRRRTVVEDREAAAVGRP
jgi:hypothetical protein